MSHGSILVVDDEAGIRQQLSAILVDEGYQVQAVASGEEALAALAREIFDLVLLDVWLPGHDGIEVLRQLRASGASVPVVMISGAASAEVAVRAVREGAQDFLDKPLALDRVLVTVANALALGRMQRRLAMDGEVPPSLSGSSPAVMELRRQIRLAAPSESRVLITGPNGAGKEVVARLLHLQSRRASGPWVAVNCAAIPSELIESELFGHLKGAFTGAVESKRGKLELADGGTLFLDEVGDMSLLTQAKVLRVLQESCFTRVGGAQEVRVDVRVIAATNMDLEAEIAAGRFRQDLYFRLNVIPIRVPALAERREDVPLLAAEFMRDLAAKVGSRPKRLSEAALARLQQHDWPGNVRELRNLVERLLIMAPGEVITDADVEQYLDVRPSPARLQGLPLKAARERFEREYIEAAVARAGGNMSQAARLLGLERSHLYRKLRSLGK
ncbi:MAG TPA: sigma-54 dependent transcriptional regulator [Thermoanaerobaculaceae bacterium]|nr:sigma-54 dependent transcriptional regulator [Thermoanaerobaculaceae bacterium]HRS17198.1 sigma-54 dependent transcriptional regulator [Thermoanaerobaculaceae bacterium]